MSIDELNLRVNKLPHNKKLEGSYLLANVIEGRYVDLVENFTKLVKFLEENGE